LNQSKHLKNPSPPHGPSYDRGAGFHRCACQGCKKLVGNKIIGEGCVWEQEEIIEPNKFSHQSFEDEKFTKMMKRITIVKVLLPPFLNSVGKTVNLQSLHQEGSI
jgi:hypothetical protein